MTVLQLQFVVSTGIYLADPKVVLPLMGISEKTSGKECGHTPHIGGVVARQ